MPNRIVRDGFIDSEAVNALGDPAECFYHRLLLAADDAGRMDGRVEMLRARLFPLSSRRASDVEKQLSDCIRLGLVIPYTWDGKPFIQLAKWQRCSPCVNSKFPWKDGSHRIVYVKRETRDGEKEFVMTSLSNADGMPIPSDPLCHECPETKTYTKTEAETNKPRKRVELATRPDSVPEQVWTDFWRLREKKRAPLTPTALAGIEAEAVKAGLSLTEALTTCCKRGWQGFEADWIKGKHNDTSSVEAMREKAQAVVRLVGGMK